MNIAAPKELEDLATWDALSKTAKSAVAADIARALGADYEVAGPFGARQSTGVRHKKTGYELLLIPGGTFQMGITEEEEQDILAVLRTLGGFPEASEDERAGWDKTLRNEVAGIAQSARPVHEVKVAPFLCGRRHLGNVERLPDWRALCEAEWEYIARLSYPKGWLLEPPLEWGNMSAPKRALTQESPLGLFDLISRDGEGFPEDGWADRGGYAGAPNVARPFAPKKGELDAVARGGPTYEWASEVAGVWAFFAGARSNAYGKGQRAAISFRGAEGAEKKPAAKAANKKPAAKAANKKPVAKAADKKPVAKTSRPKTGRK